MNHASLQHRPNVTINTQNNAQTKRLPTVLNACIEREKITKTFKYIIGCLAAIN